MSATAILVVGLGAILALPLLWRAFRGRLDLFEPIVIFAVAWAAMFVARPAAMLIRDDTVWFGLDVRETLPRAVLLGFVGAVAFIAVYELPLGRTVAARTPAFPPLDERRTTRAALGLGLLGVGALVAALATTVGSDGLGVLLEGRGEGLGTVWSGSSDYLWKASLLILPAAFVIAGMVVRRPRTPLLLAGIALTALALLRTVPAGNRIVLLPFLGGIFMLVYLVKRSRPRLVTVLAIALLSLLVSNILLVTRYPYLREFVDEEIVRIVEDPLTLVEPVLGGPDGEQVAVLAGALTVVPSELPYKHGRAVVGDLLVRPVPRELWSGKPIPPTQEVTARVWPVPVKSGFNPAFSTLLVFYWDFGIYGVLVGMAAFGLVARVLYELLMRDPASAFGQIFYAGVIWFLVLGLRDGPVETLVTGGFVVIPLLGVLVVGSRRARTVRADRREGSWVAATTRQFR